MAGRLSGNGGYGKGKRAAGPGEPEVRVELRKDEGPGPTVRVVLCNGRPGHDDIDLTRSFTSAIAHCLWMARAGDDAQNWIEAERLLERLLADKAQRPERRVMERAEPIGPLPEPG